MKASRQTERKAFTIASIVCAAICGFFILADIFVFCAVDDHLSFTNFIYNLHKSLVDGIATLCIIEFFFEIVFGVYLWYAIKKYFITSQKFAGYKALKSYSVGGLLSLVLAVSSLEDKAGLVIFSIIFTIFLVECALLVLVALKYRKLDLKIIAFDKSTRNVNIKAPDKDKVVTPVEFIAPQEVEDEEEEEIAPVTVTPVTKIANTDKKEEPQKELKYRETADDVYSRHKKGYTTFIQSEKTPEYVYEEPVIEQVKEQPKETAPVDNGGFTGFAEEYEQPYESAPIEQPVIEQPVIEQPTVVEEVKESEPKKTPKKPKEVKPWEKKAEKSKEEPAKIETVATESLEEDEDEEDEIIDESDEDIEVAPVQEEERIEIDDHDVNYKPAIYVGDEEQTDEDFNTYMDEEEIGHVSENEEDLIMPKKNRPFDLRLRTANEKLKKRYSAVRNELESYGMAARTQRSRENYRLKGDVLARFTFKGKTLYINLGLDPDKFDKDAYGFTKTEKPGYEEIPMLMPVKSAKNVKSVIELITIMMKNAGVEKVNNYKEKDYVTEYENTYSEFESKGYGYMVEHTVTAEMVDVYRPIFAERIAIKVPLTDEEPKRLIKVALRLTDLNENFRDGATIDLSVLKAKGLAPKNANYLAISANKSLSKRFFVTANEISPRAVKMICLTGGQAYILYRKGQQK